MKKTIYLFLSFAIGVSVCFHQTWLALVWLPLTFWFLKNHESRSLSAVVMSFLGASLMFLGGVIPWLPNALELVGGTSWFMTTLLLTMITVFQGLYGIAVGTAGVLFSRPTHRLGAMCLVFSFMTAAFPNLLNMSLGELLGFYDFFHVPLATVGSMGLTFVATAAVAGFTGFFALKKKSFLFLGIPLLGCLLTVFIKPRILRVRELFLLPTYRRQKMNGLRYEADSFHQW